MCDADVGVKSVHRCRGVPYTVFAELLKWAKGSLGVDNSSAV